MVAVVFQSSCRWLALSTPLSGLLIVNLNFSQLPRMLYDRHHKFASLLTSLDET